MGVFKDHGRVSAGPHLSARAPVDMRAFADNIQGRSDALQTAISSIARPGDFGRPFGPGFGLEVVDGWVRQVVPDPLEMRPIGQRTAHAIGDGIQASVIRLSDYRSALGASQESAMQYGLSRAAIKANLAACNDSLAMLQVIVTDDFKGIERWLSDERFAVRMVAYFQVAMLRLIVHGAKLRF